MNRMGRPKKSAIAAALASSYLGRLARKAPILVSTLLAYNANLCRLIAWFARSKETTNFTYDLTPQNLDYLAHTVAHVCGASFADARNAIEEPSEDAELTEFIQSMSAKSQYRNLLDPELRFGRRLGWYAFVRLLKPQVVVETGVDKGHGAVLLCAALIRNAREGFSGKYYGTECNLAAGWLLQGKYAEAGQVIYGDSLATLRDLDEEIDIFVNDSDHSAEYEYAEYCAIEPKLKAGGIILGDNAHSTRMLAKFSEERGRQFLFFSEVPEGHWYPGAGIGVSFMGPATQGPG